MAKVNYSQLEFTAGELSPRMYSRSNVEGYGAGLKECLNFITYAQGPIARRNGTKFLQTFGGNYGKVFSFQLTEQSELGEAFPIVLTDDGNLEVYGASGSVAGADLLSNPSFDNDGTDWATIDSETDAEVNFGGGNCYLKASTTDGAEDGITQQVTINQQNEEHTFTVSRNNPAVNGFFRFPPVKLMVGTAQGTDDLGSTTSRSLTVNVGSNSTVWVTAVVIGGFYEGINIPGEPEERGTYNRTIYELEFREPPIATGELIFSIGWDEQDIRDSRAVMPPDVDAIYILTSRKQPYKLSYDGADWSLDLVNVSNQPEEWEDGSWPSCLAFYQGRAWWSGVENAPAKIWSSVSAQNPNDYERIRIGQANDDDSIVFTNSRRGKIRWIEGGDTLLFGSVYGEFSVTSSSGLLTPSDFKIKQQSAYGSALVDVLSVGTSVLYVSGDKRKLRTADFEWTKQKWVSRDLTFSSEHLTNGGGIEGMANAKNPNSLIWFPLSDGSFIGATFESFTSTIGWHRHSTLGTVLSIDSIEIDGESLLYMLVRRDGNLCLELMESGLYLDSAVTKAGSDFTTVDGLDHLEGKTVYVIGDGAVQTEKTVSGGEITLDRAVDTATVGLPYTSRMRTLDLEGGAPNGSVIPYKQRRNRIMLRLIASVLPTINGNRPPTRTAPTPMGDVQPPKSGFVDVRDVGYTEGGELVVEEDLPYNVTITGIYGEVEQSTI